MITGVIKNKIDKIWTDIWAGGLTMPFKVVEQLSYLMFIRSLDQKEIENEIAELFILYFQMRKKVPHCGTF